MRVANVLLPLALLGAALLAGTADARKHNGGEGERHHGKHRNGGEGERHHGKHGHHDQDGDSRSAASDTLCIAHRGASGTHPENTVEAYWAAYAFGCDAIETDVQLTSDNTVIILHDEIHTLERTTNGTGNVYKLPYKGYIDSLVAGPNGERVPLFTDALNVLQDHINSGHPDTFFIIDIKPSNPLEIVDAMAAILAQPKYAHLINNLIFGPWNDVFLQRIIKAMPNSRRTFISELPPKVSLDVENFNTNLLGISLQRSFVRNAHAVGKTVFAWTVNTVADMKTGLNLGVDGILTNYPVTLLELLGRSNIVSIDPMPEIPGTETEPLTACGSGNCDQRTLHVAGFPLLQYALFGGLIALIFGLTFYARRLNHHNYLAIQQTEMSENKKLIP